MSLPILLLLSEGFLYAQFKFTLLELETASFHPHLPSPLLSARDL